MQGSLTRIVEQFQQERRPYALATVIRVVGSASAKPGSKAIIDGEGNNVFGWVGGGCAETLVRQQALAALEDRRTRIVMVDLDDEVLGVGMPCGGNMEVFIEPHHPPRPLVLAGHNRLARHLALLADSLGYAVEVHAPEAERAHFPTARTVVTEPWEDLRIPHDAAVIVAAAHEGQLPALRRAVEADCAHVALVARRKRSQSLCAALRSEGFPAEALARVRTPAGLDLGGETLEEISLSIMAELLATAREKRPLPLRMVKGLHAPSPAASAAASAAPGAARPADFAPPADSAPRDRPPPDRLPRLLIVGHGRIAEELARLGAQMAWPVTVNTAEAGAGEFPAATRLVTGDLDFSAMEVTPHTYVVVATLHKGDHLSMQKAMEGGAPYIGLIASRKRSGLVLEYLRERGFGPEEMVNVHAPAGLDMGARDPAEIAFSIVSEIVAVHRGGSCRPLVEVEAAAGGGTAETCLQLFE